MTKRCDCNLVFKAIEVDPDGLKYFTYTCNKCPRVVKYEVIKFLSNKKNNIDE